MVDATTMHKQVLVLQMIGRFRTLGMFHADLDPLKRQEKRYIADLDLATYGFTEADLDTEFDVGSFKAGPPRMRLARPRSRRCATRTAARSAPSTCTSTTRRPSASSSSASSRSARGRPTRRSSSGTSSSG